MGNVIQYLTWAGICLQKFLKDLFNPKLCSNCRTNSESSESPDSEITDTPDNPVRIALAATPLFPVRPSRKRRHRNRQGRQQQRPANPTPASQALPWCRLCNSNLHSTLNCCKYRQAVNKPSFCNNCKKHHRGTCPAKTQPPRYTPYNDPGSLSFYLPNVVDDILS